VELRPDDRELMERVDDVLAERLDANEPEDGDDDQQDPYSSLGSARRRRRAAAITLPLVRIMIQTATDNNNHDHNRAHPLTIPCGRKLLTLVSPGSLLLRTWALQLFGCRSGRIPAVPGPPTFFSRSLTAMWSR
jgi:hypothetical protein